MRDGRELTQAEFPIVRRNCLQLRGGRHACEPQAMPSPCRSVTGNLMLGGAPAQFRAGVTNNSGGRYFRGAPSRRAAALGRTSDGRQP
jgi:hypothetical protein